MREMIRNEPGIRVVLHIIVRASMQIACCSLSRQRQKLSTNTNTNTNANRNRNTNTNTNTNVLYIVRACKLPAVAYQGGGKSWVQSLHSCWVVKKILLATSVINTKHADDFDYNCDVFFALKMNVVMIFTKVLGKMYFQPLLISILELLRSYCVSNFSKSLLLPTISPRCPKTHDFCSLITNIDP